ncbi:hypothetical protein D3C71_1454610 [compost metagenome]
MIERFDMLKRLIRPRIGFLPLPSQLRQQLHEGYRKRKRKKQISVLQQNGGKRISRRFIEKITTTKKNSKITNQQGPAKIE